LKLTKDVVVASRYQLVECLGAGAMGEVWRAQDTRFESRTVAVKFLREDETLKEDALNRDRLVIRLEQQASRGALTFQSALEAIAAALGASNLEGLRAKAEATLGTSGFKPSEVVTVFDELVNDPTFNDNARMRAKLRRLFRDEANAVANLRHDNVVSIFDYGDHEGSPYLVMDYIEGRTLYQLIQSNELLARSRRLQLIEDLCAGLGYAHKHKLVHRDIKPANLIIDSSTGSLKILDFGVVRRLGSASTVGVPVGTFCYMSPEQTKGAANLDHRSDIFAVGLVFYELLSGKKAFPPGKSIGDLVARIQRDPPPSIIELVPTIPKSIEEIIHKAIQKLPENRYQDLAVMEREISKVRSKIEAAEQSEGTSITMVGDATIVRPRPAQPNITELLANAEKALQAGDANSAIELAKKVLIAQPGFPPAQGIVNRAESLKRDNRIRDVLQQAEKFLALEELTSARGVLSSAREVDSGSPLVKAFEAKLDSAAAARDRAQREHDQRERDQREREQREREQRAREQQELEQRRVREQQELEQRRAREQAEAEQRQQAQREREQREREQREQREKEERDRRAREERARMQREMEAREKEQRDREQRERDRRERERKEREQREREAHERALRELARPAEPSPDEPTAVTMQLSRDAIMPGMATPPEVAAQSARSKTGMPVTPPAPAAPSRTPAPPPAAAAPPPPPAPDTSAPPPAPPSQASRSGGPTRKSKRYTAGPTKSGAPVAPKAPSTPPPAAAAPRPAAAPVAGGALPAVGRSGVSPQTLAIAVGVIAVLAIIVAVLFMYNRGDSNPQVSNDPAPSTPGTSTPANPTATPPPPPTNTAPETPVTTTPTTPPVEPTPVADPPPPASMSTVYIDIRPWARVKITTSIPNVTLPTEPQYVPFALDLPAGDYTLEAENGGVNRPTTFQLKVAEGGPQTFVRTMQGFNATKIVESLLGQD
jgi:serine/threonine protein kinase